MQSINLWKFKISDVRPTNSGLIEQQRKTYSWIAANYTNSIEKMRTSKTNEIKKNPVKDIQ